MYALRPLILLFPLLLAACGGYSFGGGDYSVLPEEYRKMAIAEVSNPTMYSWMEPRLRSLFRDELTRRDLVTWVDDRARADALMTINVIRFYRPDEVTGAEDETLRSSANIEMQVVIRSARDGSVLWNSGNVAQSWPFFEGEQDQADQTVTELAVRKIADRMSQNY
ncbi:LPS assembly lipoprotein LptE [Pseudodesulfovibrio tunisiensis]|uniref:LPS assembly lipoprotein LptE n=1 Tax=Pseudodesulfovibrio tunisiensis TaxID=463192 RepID=UPI001FB5245B|nr:LPS assembly lipoprotein LptE [Pseudodesulfovibrio tunisiensis]